MSARTVPDQPPLLELRDLVVDFPLPRRGLGRRSTNRAVAGVSLDVQRAETLGLVGESGSGKTTIGRSILGLVTPSSGAIRFDGTDLLELSRSQRRAFSSEIQVVLQNPYTSLNPAIPVFEAIGEALKVHRGLHGDALDEAVHSLMRRVGLDPATANRLPHAFSGGQRQRIAIARAIALHPRFVVYDEAVSALDVSTRGQIINLMAELRRDMGLASLFIGHDLGIVRHISDRIAVLYRGHLVELGPADQIADSPQHPYTQRLVRSVLVPDPDVMASRRGERSRRASSSEPPPQGCPFLNECPERLAICGEASPVLRPSGGRAVACHLAPTTTNSSTVPPGPARHGEEPSARDRSPS